MVNGALHEDMEVTAYRFWVCDGQYVVVLVLTLGGAEEGGA